MRRGRWTQGLIKLSVMLVPGGTLLGTSCASDIRDSIISGGLDFVTETTIEVLESLIPVESVLPDEDD